MSKNKIAKELKLSKDFVIKWTQSENQDFEIDNRGWQKGKRRKWTKQTEERIKTIYQKFKDDPNQFYTGATAIIQEWRKLFPQDNIPHLRTVGQIMSDLGLVSSPKKKRNKGTAKYLCYPEYTIYTLLGGRVAEADFIGHKYISGQSKPINFIAFCFKKEPKLRYFRRIKAQTANYFIIECQRFFQKFEKPDYLKVDNCLAAIGSASGKRNISKTMQFLLNNQVVPIFSVPRRPFSQASIEGNNSVFSRFFWNKIEFQNVQEIDERLKAFNKCSQQYCNYQKPKKKSKPTTDFIPRIYFIRQVQEEKNTGKGFIEVLNEKIIIRKSYINYFVLAEWNLQKEILYVYFEKEQKQKLIKKQPFKINSNFKRGGRLSFCI